MIKVSIVEDDALYTELIVWALSKHKDIRVAGKYGSADRRCWVSRDNARM